MGYQLSNPLAELCHCLYKKVCYHPSALRMATYKVFVTRLRLNPDSRAAKLSPDRAARALTVILVPSQQVRLDALSLRKCY